jgi:hypothetical protein
MLSKLLVKSSKVPKCMEPPKASQLGLRTPLGWLSLTAVSPEPKGNDEPIEMLESDAQFF